MTTLIIIASVRRERVGGAVAEWVRDRAAELPDTEIDVADLRELALPLHDEPHHPRLAHYVGEAAISWSARVSAADAFLVVMPEYNHSYSAPLKNALDYLYREWADKPVGLVGYGGLSGGARAIVALQPVLTNLGMRQARANVEVTWVAEHLVEGHFAPSERHSAALTLLLDEVSSLTAPVTS